MSRLVYFFFTKSKHRGRSCEALCYGRATSTWNVGVSHNFTVHRSLIEHRCTRITLSATEIQRFGSKSQGCGRPGAVCQVCRPLLPSTLLDRKLPNNRSERTECVYLAAPRCAPRRFGCAVMCAVTISLPMATH